MRVLIIAPYFAPNPEVAAVRMVSLSSQLVADGHAVTVLCLSREGLLRENTPEELTAKVPEGVETIRFDIDYSTAPLVADYVNGKRFARALSGLVDPADFDVVLNTCGPYYPLEAAPIIARWGIPYVLDFRDLGAINYRPSIVFGSKAGSGAKAALKRLYGRLIKRRERRAVNLADRVICISGIDLEAMERAYDMGEHRHQRLRRGTTRVHSSERREALRVDRRRFRQVHVLRQGQGRRHLGGSLRCAVAWRGCGARPHRQEVRLDR